MVGHSLNDGGVDGGAEFRVGTKALLDSMVDDGPDLFLERGVSGVGGNEDDFVIGGESGEALKFDGLLPGLASLGDDGVRELDPMTVQVKAGDGEGFVIDVGVTFRGRLHVGLRV